MIISLLNLITIRPVYIFIHKTKASFGSFWKRVVYVTLYISSQKWVMLPLMLTKKRVVRLQRQENSFWWKKRSERRKHCALAVVRRSQKISPRRRPLPGGAGRPKFNQLETVTTFTYRPMQFGEDRCTQFRVIVITDSQTNKHTQTGPITIHCAAKLSAQYNNHDSHTTCTCM